MRFSSTTLLVVLMSQCLFSDNVATAFVTTQSVTSKTSMFFNRSHHHHYQRNEGILSSLKLLNDDNEENDHHTEGDHDNDDFSRAKWKKKRYIMLSDVDALIQKGDPSAVSKAQELVERMMHLYDVSQHDEYKPTVQAYNLWINALAKSSSSAGGRAGGGQRNNNNNNKKTNGNNNIGKDAEQILMLMKEQGVQPNVVSYTSVIDAYARCGQSKQAERILFDLLERQRWDTELRISSVTCDAVLNAWAQQGTFEAAERATNILQRMEQMSSDKEVKNSNNSSMIRPTAHSYSTVINAWAQCKDGEAAEEAEIILNQMLRNDKDNKNAVMPDTVVFNAVIKAWAQSGDARAPSQAVNLLNRMQELHTQKKLDTKPDEITYNSVITCWSRSAHVNAAQQAEKILHQMQLQANNSSDNDDGGGAVKPNTVSYNSVLHAWSKSSWPGAGERAQNVLDYMIKASKAKSNTQIEPDVFSFTSVMNAWAKSKDPNKATYARNALDQLLDRYQTTHNPKLKPSIIPFNTVLNACAFSAMGTTSDQQKKALQIAVQTFTQLRKNDGSIIGVDEGPDAITYGNMLKCCANLVPQGKTRNQMALQLFTKCCEDGMVDTLPWNELKRCLPSKVLSESVLANVKSARGSPGSIQVRDLPQAWRRNTSKKFQNNNKKGKYKQQRNKQNKKEAETSGPRPMRPFRQIREQSWQSGKDM